MQEKNLSQVLREQMQARGRRFWANDNVSEYMSEAVKEKLIEETNEFIKSNDAEELADILEVIHALGNNKGFSKDDLEEQRRTKAEERGAFNEKIILEETSD